ncbi:phage tail-like protein [Rheinheimera pacifica]|uniref:phage tail protein n=1 Tax=Rheinheimera pacifica TaxID=173990 RepID=UPI00216A6DAD|nr:phage tail protein [Rheinheimera pacifica]MCS4308107.1 phage tail-like protein [Rheinheimera pacifica]
MSELAASDYPLPAFYFRVKFASSGDSADTAFQEVSGIGAQLDTEDVVEGGENRFVHKLPKAVKHSNLVLKRGIAPNSSLLVQWCIKVFEQGVDIAITPMTITVELLDETGQPARSWSFVNAYPVSWQVEGFNASKNEVAIEKLEFSYQYLTRER